jgi:CSLREA domain-containing protein
MKTLALVLVPLSVLARVILLLARLGISAAALNHRDRSMRRFPRTKLVCGSAVAFAVLLLLLIPAPRVHTGAAADGDIIPGRYIVVLKKSGSPSAVAARQGLRPQVVYESAVRGFAGSFSDKAIRRLRADPSVLLVEPDRVATVDDAQTLPFGIDRIDADLSFPAKIDGVDDPLDVDIAIIDTGIQLDHPDLRVAGGVRFIGSDCAGGSYADDYGHGTHVAGTAAAIDNAIGVVGVAPGARLWAVKVLDQNGSGSLSCMIEAVDWVTANAATIEAANISVRFSPSAALCQAITASAAAGVVYAVSAGNQAKDASSQSPADCPDVLSTSAIADFDGRPGGLNPQTYAGSCTITGDDIFACFSNYGPLVDIAAPGVKVYSTYIGGGYATMSGTSMAAPHVAGAAALDIVEHGKPTDAAGAAAVRARLIAAGAPQDGSFGFSGDPDSYHEPLLFLASEGAYDAAVTAVTTPPVIMSEQLVQIDVALSLNATSSQTLSVALAASGGAVLDSPQTVTLEPHSSTTASFTWDTTGVLPGDYSLTATAVGPAGDMNTGNNSLPTTATVRLPAHDVAVVAINAPAVVVLGLGSTTSVEVTAANPGTFDETFSVSLEASGGGVGGSPQPVTLAPGSSTTVSFTWDTTGLSPAEYALTATASVVPGETNTADNSSSTAVTVRLAVHDVAVVGLDAPSAAAEGSRVQVHVMAMNAGELSETFSVSLEASGGSVEGSPQTIALTPGESAPLSFTWHAQDARPDPYVLTATAGTVPGEESISDNSLAAEVLVTVLQDIVVNSPADPGSGLCDAMECTLREAILLANATPGPARISFNILDGSSQTIAPLSALPDITDPVTIDGATQPGYAGTPIIELSGAATGTTADGLRVVGGGGSTIRGMVINRFSGDGIELSGKGGNVVQGNFIGTDVAGTVALGNAKEGISVIGSPYSSIGGTAPGAGNVVSSNEWAGIFIASTAPGTVIQGNFIGTDITGAIPLRNLRNGVYVFAQNTIVGGTAAGAANTIAYNHGQGVFVSGATARGNTIRGNSIHSNDGKGIYINPGANGGVAPPTITAAGPVSGTACANCTVDVYSDDTHEGWIYHGSTQADGAGNWSFPGGASGPRFTATATDASGNTSEFSASFPCEGGCPAPAPTPTPPPGFLPPYVLKDPTTQTNAYFGRSVAVGDVDGDGKGDIAVGASDEDVNGNADQGRAYVFSGATSSLLLTLDIPKPQAGTWSGYSVAVGDVNGDDKADIAMGAPSENVDGNEYQGRAYVFSGANGSLLFTLDTPNPQTSALFGWSVAVGDVNGDSNADIAVGTPYEDVGGNTDQGRAYVFSGANGSLLFTLDTSNPQGSAYFGYSVAVGDVNGDDKADIAVGAILEDVSGNAYQGRAYVFSGADRSLLFTLDTPNPQTYARFGSSVGVGDANADGKGDIAVGAPYEDVIGNGDQGRVHVFSGADGSLLFTLDTPNPQAMARFGDSVAMGDVDDNGTADIAVGASYEDVNDSSDQGRVHVFSGANGSLLFTLDTSNPQGSAYFGYSVAVGDVNGDGKGDMAAGASQGGCGRGAVYVFASNPDYSPTPTPTPAPPFGPVGGIAELPDAPLSAAANQMALAALAAAALLALSAGAWYARRRFSRG